MTHLLPRAAILAAALALVFSAPEAQAQGRWLRTVEIVAPVNDELATGALLDSLVELAQSQNMQVRRAPTDQYPDAVSFEVLQEQLLDDGLDVTSANRVFVTYRFEADERGFRSEVRRLYFIYRPDQAQDTDIPIFVVDGSHPDVHYLLTETGTQLRVNEAAFKPFIEQIKFTDLIGEGTIVRLGDEIVRDEEVAAAEERRLIQTIRRFMY